MSISTIQGTFFRFKMIVHQLFSDLRKNINNIHNSSNSIQPPTEPEIDLQGHSRRTMNDKTYIKEEMGIISQ
jgi:hypothetical protein